MSYGIQLTNEFGDRVLESTGVFFEQSRGMMNWVPPHSQQNSFNFFALQSLTRRFVRWIHADGPLSRTPLNRICYDITNGGSWSYPGVGGVTLTTGHPYDACILQWSGSSDLSNTTSRTDQRASGSSGANTRYVPNAIPNTADFGAPGNPMQELFFRIPERGLHCFGSVYNPYTNFFGPGCTGLIGYGMANWREPEGLQYVVATTEEPSLDGSTYGMLVRDEDGATIFDSRYVERALRIKAYITITEEELTDCLVNGTTYNYTIRQPILNPYIGGDTLLGYNVDFNGRNHDFFYPNLRIINNTSANPTLILSRQQYRFISRATRITLPGGSRGAHGATFLIADIEDE